MKWVTRGFLPSFASPVMDDDRLYTVDNSAILGAFDLEDRQGALDEDARHAAKRHRRCSPTASSTSAPRTASSTSCGRPRPALTSSTRTSSARPTNPEPIVASPAIADGRLYVTSMAPPSEAGIGRTSVRDRDPEGARTHGHRRSAGYCRSRRSCRSGRAGAGLSVRSLARLRRKAVVHAEAVRREGQLHSQRAGERRAVDARSAAAAPSAPTARTSRRRRRIGRIREGDDRRRHRSGARARDSAAAVDATTSTAMKARRCPGGRRI